METQSTRSTKIYHLRSNKPEPISDEELDRSFKPHGAMAFFMLLILLCGATWYAIYLLMLSRA